MNTLNKLMPARLYALLGLSGIFCGLLQGLINLPIVALGAYIPLMLSLSGAKNKTQFLKFFGAFFLPYYFVQLSFLITIYDLIPTLKFLSVLLTILATLLLTLWECGVMLLPVYQFCFLRTDTYRDIFTLSLLISLGEWFSQRVPILSFSWSAVWLSVTDFPLFLQSANLLGCGFVSFLILCVNGFLGRLIISPRKLASLSCLFACLGFIFIYGKYSLTKTERISADSQKLSVVCAQDSLMGKEKNSAEPSQAINAYREILLNLSKSQHPNLIILPETSLPKQFDITDSDFQLAAEIAEDNQCTLLLGCFFDRYNSMLAISPDGNFSSPYCKQILVPFGETVPFGRLFHRAGLCVCEEQSKILPLNCGAFNVCTVICIESVFPHIARKQVSYGAELISVSTNDSWFGGSFARSQHFRHSIMRAVENRRWLCRAGNCGISAIISPTGEISQIKSDTSKGTVSGEISLISDKTLYTRLGDLLTLISFAVAFTGFLKNISAKRKILKK